MVGVGNAGKRKTTAYPVDSTETVCVPGVRYWDAIVRLWASRAQRLSRVRLNQARLFSISGPPAPSHSMLRIPS